MSKLKRRKRLSDGTFGPLETVFEGIDSNDSLKKLEEDNQNLKEELAMIQEYIVNKQYENLLGGEADDI